VSTSTTHRRYTIREAATLTGLPASTLRYYESIGVVAPVSRGESSKHRVYGEDDLDQLMWVACLAATGMSVSDMRQYVANGQLGPSAAAQQAQLLETQQRRLAMEAKLLAVRQQYVQIKIDYWHAIAAGDNDRAGLLSSEARALADQLKRVKQQ
jgi:DNA-binding transcriptional MerR regulator